MGTAEWFDGMQRKTGEARNVRVTKLEPSGRQGGKSTPPFGPDDLRKLATDAVRMQDALIAIQAILQRPPKEEESLVVHQALIIRDIHKVVNLPPPLMPEPG